MAIKRLLQEETPTSEAIALVLQQAGIDMVFGIPGGHTGHIFIALSKHQNSIRTVLVREESLAGVMAEVYGRLTGRPGVIIGQGPWVLGNGLIGTIEAFMSSSPMLLLTDFSDTPALSLHGPYQSGTGDYGSWDARQSFSGVTKAVIPALEPASAVHGTQLAIKHSLTGQRGPVAVLYSISALAGHVGPDSVPRLYDTGPYIPQPLPPADTTQVSAAAKALTAAQRPVIVAGNGTRIGKAYEQLQALAEALGIPVVSTPSGKGCFAETHPLALGVFGTFGTPAANACVAEADVVLIVGSKMTASDTARENPALLDPERQIFIQIDVEPRNLAWTFPVEHQLLGEAGIVLDQLRLALPDTAKKADAGKKRVADYRAKHGFFDDPKFRAGGSPVAPQRIIAELQRALPDNGIVTCDAGENRIFMTHFFQTKQAGSFLQAAGAGPMGFAIPAAIAVKLIHPERPVVAVCGDGGFAMTMNGLMTALESDAPIVTVVFNNHALGWSKHSRGPFATEFGDFDHAAIAISMGCKGIRVRDADELAPALAEAFKARLPTVIDVQTSMDVAFSDLVSPLAK
jgi:acetolactate synthase I/II/III large subunit